MSSMDRRTLVKSAAALSAAGPFAGLVAQQAAQAAHVQPRLEDLVPIADKRDGKVRLHLPMASTTARSTTPKRPSRCTTAPCCPAGTTAWAPSEGPTAPCAGAQPRGQQPGAGVRPGNAVRRRWRAAAPRRPGHQARRSPAQLHQSQRHDDELLRRQDAVGRMGHLRGDGQRSRRAAGLHRGVQHALTKPHGYVFEVPARRQSAASRTDRCAAPGGSRTRRSRSTRGTATSTSPRTTLPSLGLLPLPPPVHPMKAGRLEDGGRLQMLKVRGTRNAHLEGAQVEGATYDVKWVDIDDPAPRSPTRPARSRTTTERHALTYVGSRAGRRARRSSPGWRARLRRRCRLLHLDPGRRSSRRRLGRPSRLRQRVRPGLGLLHPLAEAASRLPVARSAPARLPGQRHHQPARDAGGLRGQHQRQLHPGPPAERSALGHRAQPAPQQHRRRPQFNDEFAGSTFSPDGRTLFVNIQASAGMTFAIWGPWRSIGV